MNSVLESFWVVAQLHRYGEFLFEEDRSIGPAVEEEIKGGQSAVGLSVISTEKLNSPKDDELSKS